MRAPILALKAEDHYVRVYTERGDTLILMRFADAVEHVAHVQGLTVHRSYWVSAASVEKLVRNGRRFELKLSCGLIVPVSRAHEDAAQKAFSTS